MSSIGSAAAETRWPEAWRGSWEQETGGCSGRIPDALVTVSATEIAFYASVCRVARLTPESRAGYRTVETCRGEENSRFATRRTIRLLPSGRLEIRDGATRWELARCAAP